MTPCNVCGLPIPSDVHAEELGMCLDCSNAYFDETCLTCGEPIEGGSPFATHCDACLEVN